MPTKDRKVAAIGLTRLLTQSQVMLREPAVAQWCAAPSPHHIPEPSLTPRSAGPRRSTRW